MTYNSVTEFQAQVEQLSNYQGSNTELVSVYLPPDTSVQAMQQRIAQEHAEAQNIKSKSTRQNVQDALAAVKSALQSYTKTPENGLVVFSGVVETENGTEQKTFVFDDLPHPIKSQIYHCDDTFHTEPIEGLGVDTSIYAIILVDRNDAAIGRMTNAYVETITTLSSLVPGKQKKGGQSQQRFERLRLEALDNHYQKIAEKANDIFVSERHNIDGVLIGGPEITRSEFIDENYLHHELQKKIIYQGSVSNIGESGVEELAESASETIQDEEIAEQKEICNDFFSNIADNLATYGIENIKEAISYGSVETLLISEKFYPDLPSDIEDLIENTEDYGGDIVIIPDTFAKGEQFKKGFGGVGAILRYQID